MHLKERCEECLRIAGKLPSAIGLMEGLKAHQVVLGLRSFFGGWGGCADRQVAVDLARISADNRATVLLGYLYGASRLAHTRSAYHHHQSLHILCQSPIANNQ